MKLTGVRSMFVIGGCLTFAGTACAAVSLRVVSTAVVQAEGIARDVRWAGPSEVYVGLGRKGVIRTRPDATDKFVTVMPPADRGGYALSGRVAATQKYVIAGSPIGGFGWIPLGPATAAGVKQKGLLTLMDIDARGDIVAVLGADSGDQQGLSREGVIAWTGSLSSNLADMRPLMKGRSSPGGKDMARCSVLETGAIRFMRDGSVVVVPGTEPGVYRYDDHGKLVQTWDSAALGIVDDCAMTDDDLALLARDFGQRIEWLGARVVVDDILPLRLGPALLLRRVENNVTKWDVVTLRFDGKTERTPLPVTIPSPRGHVRGDVRGDRAVLLVFEDPMPGQKPMTPPQLMVLAVGGQ